MSEPNGVIKIFFNEVKDNECRLSNEEEFDLLSRAKTGETKAINQIIFSNSRFVIKQAKLKRMPLYEDDLIQCGIWGLYVAIEKYKLETKNRFISYAQWHVTAKMNLFLRGNLRTIQLPHNILNKIRKGELDLENFARTTTTEREPESIETYLENENLFDIYTKDEKVELLLKHLDSKHRDILIKKFGLFETKPMTYTAIAKQYRVGSAAIRYHYDLALESLKNRFGKEKLIEILTQ